MYHKNSLSLRPAHRVEDTRWYVVVHLYCSFSLRHQMAPQQGAKFRTAFLFNFFQQFEEGYRRQLLCMDLEALFCGLLHIDVLYKALNDSLLPR